MNLDVSLITPTYVRDFDRCKLLCESIDAFVSGYTTHYLLVADDDAELFSTLAGNRRVVVTDSDVLGRSLRKLPRFMRWRGRQYYWAAGAGLPVYGWHVQQLRKLAMTAAQQSPRVICIDSDNCFVRPFNALSAAAAPKSPLYLDPVAIDETHPSHVAWRNNAYRLLGLTPPPLPGDDFIGQMIVWDRQSLVAVLDRVEGVTGLPWWKALCRARDFSEYILYGVGVVSNDALRTRHEATNISPCATYWSGPALDYAGVRGVIEAMDEQQYAIAVQSHTATDASIIRRAALSDVV